MRDGSWSLREAVEVFEPARLGWPRMVLVFLLSLDACDVWEDERLLMLLPLSDMVLRRCVLARGAHR